MVDIAGLNLIVPTSIANSGGSASLGANGKVSFTATVTISVNGCFTSAYDNYVVLFYGVESGAGSTVEFFLRASGSDASGSDYASQRLNAGASVTGDRLTSQTQGRAGAITGTDRSAFHLYFYGPYLAQPTAARNVGAGANSGALIQDVVSTHSLSTSYDGFTFRREGGSPSTLTGTLAVYGLSQ